jgi:hypothetical protein
MQSREATPLSDPEMEPNPRIYGAEACDSPIEMALDQRPAVPAKDGKPYGSRQLLPYEISIEEFHETQEGSNRGKRMRGMLGRVFGAGVAVR